MTPSDVERYWSYVDKRGPDECWPWLGGTFTHAGHARFWLNGRSIQASHISLILDGKPKPKPPENRGLHSCDTPSCQNPNHLRWGTQLDNIEDRQKRGRAWHKLSPGDIVKIQAMNGSAPQLTIANMFGISQAAVSNIMRTGKAHG